MWNKLNDGENIDVDNYGDPRNGSFQRLKKYKTFFYLFFGFLLALLITYALYEYYFNKNGDFKLNCNDLNERCLNYKFPSFKPERLHIVDVNIKNNNYILRSSIPLFNGVYSEEKLLRYIKKLFEENNLSYSDNLTLHIISFLRNDLKEGCSYTSEHCYNKKNNIFNHIILGHQENPYDINEDELNDKLKSMSWNTDNLINRIKNLKEKFNTMKNTIFFIHCRRGRDRTGEFVSAYKMIEQNKDFNSIVEENEEIGKVKPQYLNMQKWLCLYLERILKNPNVKCFNFS
ncbi:protein phosphatase, putative [Plasmodium sp. gorilla clade G3]|nr:protein phosphatase, putative [Plasmodium sp. gorilla clade G3]